jgi:DNA (cytosine-5)-methyltransferase 1
VADSGSGKLDGDAKLNREKTTHSADRDSRGGYAGGQSEQVADAATVGHERGGRARARDCGPADASADVGDANQPRPQGRGEPQRGGSDELPAWPPGPESDWSNIPVRLWPALSQPELRRVADGHAPRMDRLRACGNGVVPLVAAYAFRTLSDEVMG